ncbi:reverse transcriptase N-terminal domain-containing protein [Wolbachia endosymbiont of Drosophila innubila]|uniref:reverse transcriptase N-terminal domain-containing protein n=1 Tax=Wolbachia endosymbiont of Drosophila innubila TaxID=282263 RepID=UPI001F47F7ED|nr:reverse transcriptase N-terminal domain-containing protein [Wolbachia endosymbiont of Drosophila innubila]
MRLQRRIVKAVQQGRWGKVKTLQHLLQHKISRNKAIKTKRIQTFSAKTDIHQ